jgi:hypothetical protein
MYMHYYVHVASIELPKVTNLFEIAQQNYQIVPGLVVVV